MKKLFAVVALIASLSAVGAPALAADAATKAYQTKVNAICKAGIAKLNAIPSPTGPADLQKFLEKGLSLTKELISSVKAVPAPAGVKANVTKALAAQQKGADLIAGLITDIKKGGDPAKLLDAAGPKISAATKAADPAWTAAGLTACTE